MGNYETYKYDVVIVGGGGAGLRAAIAVAETNPALKVALVSKVYPMRSHTVSAEGGAAAVIKENDSFDEHCSDTILGSDWLADQDAVELFVKEAPSEMIQLEHWGCPWSREPNGKVAVRPFGGMKIERTWFAADKTGFHMLHTLFQTSLKYDNVTHFDEWFATKVLVENGRCQGITALELRSGQIRGLPGTGILITEAARGEGGILVNKDGYRYLQDYDLGKPLEVTDSRHPVKKTMELGPRDRLSLAFMKEVEKGRTLSGAYGEYVHLDLRHLGEKKIDKKIPFVRELSTKYAGIDPVYEPIPVRPVVHYMMGGVDTDIDGGASIPGVFSAGEAACVSINGANRLGSNSLTELLVFGAIAGRAAARFATEHPELDLTALQKQGADEQERIAKNFIRKDGGYERVATLRQEMKGTMEPGAGLYCSVTSLKETCNKLAELRGRFSNILIEDRSLSFNTELTSALELDLMLDVAQAIAHSALARTESRGSHQRTDYPDRNDEKFLKHSLAFRTDGAPRIEYKDVIITRWPPAERVYGR